MQTQNIESENFIDFLFRNSPKPKQTINLQFQTNNLKELFENLLDIFTQGMKIKYANKDNKVDLEKLTPNNIANFNEYFHSFGINLNILVENYNFLNPDKYNKLKYTNLQINNNTKINN